LNNLEKIYNEVADEVGLSRAKVRVIAEAQFSFINLTMQKKDLSNVRLQYWGTFKVKPGRLKHLSPQGKKLITDKTDEFNKFL
jgi:nucleoid DNA-binding protein